MTTQANILHSRQPNGSVVMTNEKTGAQITLTKEQFMSAEHRTRAAATLRPLADPRGYLAVKSPAEQLAEERKAKEGSDPEPYCPLPLEFGREGGPRAAQRKLHAEWVERQAEKKRRTQKLSDDERLAGMVAKHIAEIQPEPVTAQEPVQTEEERNQLWERRRQAIVTHSALKRTGTPEQIAQSQAELNQLFDIAEQPTAQEQSNGG